MFATNCAEAPKLRPQRSKEYWSLTGVSTEESWRDCLLVLLLSPLCSFLSLITTSPSPLCSFFSLITTSGTFPDFLTVA